MPRTLTVSPTSANGGLPPTCSSTSLTRPATGGPLAGAGGGLDATGGGDAAGASDTAGARPAPSATEAPANTGQAISRPASAKDATGASCAIDRAGEGLSRRIASDPSPRLERQA